MIGVFDSGYGGLTILQAFAQQLPEYSYMYYGDNAHAPYGDLSMDEIFELTLNGVEWLFNHGAQLVVLGCNTSSASVLRKIQQGTLLKSYPGKRVLGIIVPTIEQITGSPWIPLDQDMEKTKSSKDLNVGILATSVTVDSNVYGSEIHKRAPFIKVFQQSCPKLAKLIESDTGEIETRTEAEHCIDSLVSKSSRLDAVLLGCTHYELVAPMIKSLLPKGINLYEQPTITATSLCNYLERHPEIEEKIRKGSQKYFFTTGDSATVSSNSNRYFGSSVKFQAAV